MFVFTRVYVCMYVCFQHSEMSHFANETHSPQTDQPTNRPERKEKTTTEKEAKCHLPVNSFCMLPQYTDTFSTCSFRIQQKRRCSVCVLSCAVLRFVQLGRILMLPYVPMHSYTFLARIANTKKQREWQSEREGKRLPQSVRHTHSTRSLRCVLLLLLHIFDAAVERFHCCCCFFSLDTDFRARASIS